WGTLISVLSVVIVMAITWLILRLTDPIYKVLGEIGSDVVSRVMAIFLAAIAVQFVVNGLLSYF
ncbi:MAG: MarC family protein, partial [Nitrososphaerota archaeon]